jgi:hypothetical protein
MKKLLLAVLFAILVALPMGSAALADGQASAQAGDAAVQGTDFLPGSSPAEGSPAQTMTPALHAAVLAMLHRDMDVYDPADADLNWETLYNMLSLYGQMDARADYEDEELVLPAETVLDFSSALPSPFEDLGPLPADLSDRMDYVAADDSYRLVCGSDSLADIQLEDARQTEDGLELTGALVYQVDGSELARFQATLQPQDNLFGYSIAALELK